MELHAGTQRTVHEGEGGRAAQPREPERHAQDVGQLGLPVATAGDFRVSPGIRVRQEVRIAIWQEPVSERSSRVDDSMCTVRCSMSPIPPSSYVRRCAWMTMGR